MDVKICIKDSCDSFSFTAILDDRGRITIPAFIRKRLSFRFGSTLDVEVSKSRESLIT